MRLQDRGAALRASAALCRRCPSVVAVRERMDGAPVVQLERERKIITDTFKMVAYRAETQLANLVALLPSMREESYPQI